jgi:serine/threonine protein kinase
LGTIVYMAPEIVSNKKYDSAVDMWSLGIVILQLLLMIPQNKVQDVRVKLIKDAEYVKKLLEGYDEKVSAICSSCLKIDPVERPTAVEVINFINDPKAKDLEHHDDNSNEHEDVSKEGVDPLLVLGNKKAQQFWKECSFEIEVDWEDFRDQYLKFTDWKRLNKEQERGFKRLLAYEGSDGRKKTNCYKVSKGLSKAGFPFSPNILASIERYSDLSNDLHTVDRLFSLF